VTTAAAATAVASATAGASAATIAPAPSFAPTLAAPALAPAPTSDAIDDGDACDAGLGGVRLVYFETRGNFPEVLHFMGETAAALGVPCETLRGGFKAGLQQLLAEGVRCVLMGTRRADPDGGLLEVFSPTSLDWPPLMRVCPALLLSYADVWAVLRGASLPFCELYCEGFTSLGAQHDSARNPALALGAAAAQAGVEAGEGGGAEDAADAEEEAEEVRAARARGAAFLPAWLLRDGALERAGRGGGAR